MKNLLMKSAALAVAATLSSSVLAQSQWWWERFDPLAKVNTTVAAVDGVPQLVANPTGVNVQLNKSTSTQPALVIMGSAVGSITGPGYVASDVQISVANGVGAVPINSAVPNYLITVSNLGGKPVTANVTYAASTTGAASAALGAVECVAAPGGSCSVPTPGKAQVGVPVGGSVMLSVPVIIGTGLGTMSLTATAVVNSGIVDTNPSNNMAVLTNPVVGGVADIAVTVTDGNQSQSSINTPQIYTLIIANDGPSAATVSVPTSIVVTGATLYTTNSVTLDGEGGASGSTVTGQYVLPPDSYVAVTANITPTIGAGTLSVSASSTILTPNTVDPNLLNNSSTDVNLVQMPIVRPEGVPATAPAYTNNLAGAGAYDVIFGDGIFYAMTSDPAFNLVSTDGINWFKSPRPFPTSTQVPMYGDGMLIETMSDPLLGYKYAVSTDNGQTWTIGTLPEPGLYIAQTYAEGRFVAIAASDTATFTAANSDTILYSKDGYNWSVQQMPYSVRWYDVVNNGREFVAVSLTDNRAGYSENGQVWSGVTLPGNSATTYGTITAGGGKFVTLSRTGGYAATSRTGKTWSSAPVLNIPWSAIAYGNGKYAAIAEGHNVLAQSTNGLNWTYTYPLSGSRAWKSLAFGNGVFVGVASDSSTPIVFP